MQDKINDCLENIREMKEIETQLQQSFGVDPHITKSCASDIDSWLVKWKITRERNIEFYTCISGLVGQHVPKVKVALRKLEKSCYFFFCSSMEIFSDVCAQVLRQ